MSWLSSAVKKAGGVVKKAAPIVAPVLAATGVGLPAAALIAGGSRVLGGVASGEKLGSALTGGVTTGVTGAVTGGLAGKVASGGLGALLKTPTSLGTALGGAIHGIAGGTPAAGATGGTGQAGGLAGLAHQLFGGGTGRTLGTLAGVGLGVAGLKQQNAAQTRANTLLQQQTQLAQETATAGRQLLADAAPVRAAAQQQLLTRLSTPTTAAPDTARLTDTGNPFAARFAAAPAAPALPALPPAPSPTGALSGPIGGTPVRRRRGILQGPVG